MEFVHHGLSVLPFLLLTALQQSKLEVCAFRHSVTQAVSAEGRVAVKVLNTSMFSNESGMELDTNSSNITDNQSSGFEFTQHNVAKPDSQPSAVSGEEHLADILEQQNSAHVLRANGSGRNIALVSEMHSQAQGAKSDSGLDEQKIDGGGSNRTSFVSLAQHAAGGNATKQDSRSVHAHDASDPLHDHDTSAQIKLFALVALAVSSLLCVVGECTFRAQDRRHRRKLDCARTQAESGSTRGDQIQTDSGTSSRGLRGIVEKGKESRGENDGKYKLGDFSRGLVTVIKK